DAPRRIWSPCGAATADALLVLRRRFWLICNCLVQVKQHVADGSPRGEFAVIKLARLGKVTDFSQGGCGSFVLSVSRQLGFQRFREHRHLLVVGWPSER